MDRESSLMAALFVLVLAIGFGFILFGPQPQYLTVCDRSHIEHYTTVEYNVALKMTMPVSRSRTVCDVAHTVPNPRYRPPAGE